MPLNLETLFQRGGYTASPSVTPSDRGDPLALEKLELQKENLALDKQRFGLEKEKTELDITAARKKLTDQDLIDTTVQRFTTVNQETGEAVTNNSSVISSLMTSGKVSAVNKFKEQLAKDLEMDTKEVALNKDHQSLVTNLTLDAMDKAVAGDGQGALYSANAAAKMTNSSPIVDIAVDANGQAKIRTKDNQEQIIDIEKYRKSAVDANVIYSAQHAEELARIKAEADVTGLKLSDPTRQAMASAKLEGWKIGLNKGEPLETLVGKYGYIDEQEISYITKQRGMPNVEDMVKSTLASQTWETAFKGPEKLKSLNEVAAATYRAMIAKEVPKDALNPSVRDKFYPGAKTTTVTKGTTSTGRVQRIRQGLSDSGTFAAFKKHTGSKALSVDEVTDAEIEAFIKGQ